MEKALVIIGTLVLIYLGYDAFKAGLSAFRKNEKSIGPYIPKNLLFLGIIVMVGGIAALIKILISIFTK